MTHSLAIARSRRGAYAERRARTRGWLDEAAHHLVSKVTTAYRARPARWRSIASSLERDDRRLCLLPEREISARIDELRSAFRRGGLRDALIAPLFALAREVASREIGQRPYPVQLRAAWVLLEGMVAEMATGEGKTLAATPAAVAMALAGVPTHVITVNDYLARRDARGMTPIYRRFGLSVGLIQQGMSPDERRAQYACDITYVTNKEVAFDYLKDRIALGRVDTRSRLCIERIVGKQPRTRQLLLRGLWFAIVDEADSALIDEARTPLIISGPQAEGDARETYATALSLARELESGRHFSMEASSRRIDYREEGRKLLAKRGEAVGGLFRGRRRRESLVQQALVALHALHLDRDYLVRDEKVQIVDEFTGRVMPDRAWEQGLHQLLEVKEGLELTTRRAPLARISYQRFFARYLRLGGMTGTAHEVRRELLSVYGLRVVRIPTHRPVIRRDLGERVFRRRAQKWQAVAERVEELVAGGRPVLVGTRSVEASEQLSALLADRGIAHRVLNARQDEGEAEIVAQAGHGCRVTVATNMAGRGTDIELGEGVARLGGLAVIGTERHEARRIDRQLFGRSGRQGDPGTSEMFVSLEDEIVSSFGLGAATAALGSAAVRAAQFRAERAHARLRRRLQRADADLGRALAFSGRGE